MFKSTFRDTTPFEKRCADSSAIRIKYPERIPVICEVVASSSKQIQLDRRKYLVPVDLSIGQFLAVVRKRIKVGAEQAIYMFHDDGAISMHSQVMSAVYQEQKNEDGFIYLWISVENTFG